GDVVVDGALPLAERVAAGEAAAGLLRGDFRLVARIDLVKHHHALGHRDLLGLAAREFQELQRLVDHQAAARRFSIRESIEAALGFTSQKWPMKERRSLRISSP